MQDTHWVLPPNAKSLRGTASGGHMTAKRESPICVRITSPKLKAWLDERSNKSRVINDALKVHMGTAPWRESDNDQLKKLLTELNMVGLNVNQIAKNVNRAALSGRQPKYLEDMELIAAKLKELHPEILKILKTWKA